MSDGQPQLNEDGSVTTPDQIDTHTDEELRDIRELLEDVTGVNHGDSPVESAWLEQIEDFIRQRERAAQLALIERLRMEFHGRDTVAGHKDDGWNEAVDDFNARLDEEKERIERVQAVINATHHVVERYGEALTKLGEE